MTVDSAIDRLNTLCRGSTLYPRYGTLASHSHSGGPKHSDETLPLSWHSPDHFDQLPLRARSWVAPCLPKTPTATVVEKRSQTGTRYHNNNRAHKVMSAYRARVHHAHNLPSREAPVRGTTKDRIKTFPLGKYGCTKLKPDSVAP